MEKSVGLDPHFCQQNEHISAKTMKRMNYFPVLNIQ